MFKKRIFLDYASATPVLPRAMKVMQKYFKKFFHNPSSIYDEGRQMRSDLEGMRSVFARDLGVKQRGVIFTSGGTEANNLAILGLVRSAIKSRKLSKDSVPHIILTEAGHSSLIALKDEVERLGGRVSIVERERGEILPDIITKFIEPDTALVSIPFSDNYNGTILPISKIARIIKRTRNLNESTYPFLHIDGSQALLTENLNLEKLGADLITLDSNKIYGPKGAGLIAFRSNLEILPILLGGDQEYGLRAGTENLPAIAGFTEAWKVIRDSREKNKDRLINQRNYFVQQLSTIPNIEILGEKNSLPGQVFVRLPERIMAEYIVLALERRGVLVSAGSACLSLGEVREEGIIRFSLGLNTKNRDLKKASKIFSEIIKNATINL